MSRDVIVLLLIAILGALIAAGAQRGFAATAAGEGAMVYDAKCAACHQADGRGGGPNPPLAHNPNVTAADTQQLIATVISGRHRQMIAGRTSGEAMPAQSQLLSDAQIAAVLTYIRSSWGNNAPAVSQEQVSAAEQPNTSSGAAIFVTSCGNCHPAGGGRTSSAPPLDGNPHVTAADPKAMIVTIVNGMSGPLTVNGTTYNAPMPSWRTRLSNADVALVTTYIRSAWSNQASAVTEEEVAAAGPAVSATIGHAIYDRSCASCHGAQGSAPGAQPLAGNLDVIAADPSGIIRTVKLGKNAMPSWRGQLSDADIASVVTYIRSAWGNHASAVSEADVRQ